MKDFIRFIWGLILIVIGFLTIKNNIDYPITFVKALFILGGLICIIDGYDKIDEIWMFQ